MSLILDGTAGVTFPSGTNPQAAPSKVLQVVNATTQSAISTSSSSFVTTGFSVSITPLFSTSKILLMVSGGGAYSGTTGNSIYITIYRGSTNLGDTSNGLCRIYGGSSSIISPNSMQALDSPATTSATTYTCYFKSSNGSTTVDFSQTDRGYVSFTAMEIAA